MSDSTAMSELKELALRNIGRNVVNFQKIEGMLKMLLSHSNFRSPVSKVQETIESRQKEFERQSLGNLTKEYFKSFGKSMEHVHAVPEVRDEPWISLSFTIDNEEGHLPLQKAAISFLVSERNRLIHQMLVRFNPESEESCRALIHELDEQNEMVKREYSNLQATLKAVYEARNELLMRFVPESDDLNGHR